MWSSTRAVGAGATTARMVKWNVLPGPPIPIGDSAGDSTHIVPPISSVRRRADGQPQPGAAKAARGRRIRMAEGLEQLPHALGRDAVPVSRTEKCSDTGGWGGAASGPVSSASASQATVTTTSPFSNGATIDYGAVL